MENDMVEDGRLISENNKKKSVFQELKESWGSFLGIILAPVVLIPLVGTSLLIAFTANQLPGTVDPAIDVILTIIIAMFSGVAGAIIAKKWSALNEGSILITRGKSAIRGLKLLLLSIDAVEKRIIEYAEGVSGENQLDYHVKMSYEELIGRCNLIQEEAINAIEEWQDIIPEVANVKTQIGVISEIKRERTELQEKISGLSEEISEVRDRSDEKSDEVKILSKELEAKQIELRKVNRNLREMEDRLNRSVLSGLGDTGVAPSSPSGSVISFAPITGAPRLIQQTTELKCHNCGNEWNTPLENINNICPQCGEIALGIP